MTLLRINNEEGQSYEIKQKHSGIVEVITPESIRYIEPDKLLELVDEHNDGEHSPQY